MRKLLSRPGTAPAAAGLAILLQAAIARMILAADETRVYFLGHPLNWECSLRAHYGLPCPTCGLTRSVILTLHGHLARAWHLAPGGPALTLGVLLAAAGVLILAAAQFLSANRTHGNRWLEQRIKLTLQSGTIVWASVSIVIWLAGWAGQFSSALQAVH
ncbi:MAG TPA: DUF2752 domain-containing protein [Bryobacteraceae bacterium]|nr:DUF2752 domain-containing protein [Bryobacteraceae bacterium]